MLFRSGDFFLLEDLGWVKKENLSISKKDLSPNGMITEILSLETDESLTLDFKYSGNVFPALKELDDQYSLCISGAIDMNIDNSYVKNGHLNLSNFGLVYNFTPSIYSDIYGYTLENFNTYFRIVFYKKPIPLTGSETPLKGLTFILDPGHGGAQSGAASCNPSFLEKQLNLDYSLLLGKEHTRERSSHRYSLGSID